MPFCAFHARAIFYEFFPILHTFNQLLMDLGLIKIKIFWSRQFVILGSGAQLDVLAPAEARRGKFEPGRVQLIFMERKCENFNWRTFKNVLFHKL